MLRHFVPCILMISASAQERPLPMRFANLPACPAAGATDSSLLLRVEDPSKTAIEVWCSREAPGFAYEYKLKGQDGSTRRLDRCQLADGLNSVGVEHLGAVSEPGAGLLKMSGRLLRFVHHNWDTHLGHHAIYDFSSQRITYYGTEAYQDGIGRWMHLLTGAGSAPLASIPQNEPKEALGKLNAPRGFDPKRSACVTAQADDGHRILEQEVDAYNEPGILGKATVGWPESTQIANIAFNPRERKLYLRFPPGARKTMISLAFPRKLLGIGKEVTKVRLDGQFIETEEYITHSHRAVRFRLDNPAKEALLTESGGFPFFLVSSVAIVGGLLIGAVVALLFRRKLPAVAPDPD